LSGQQFFVFIQAAASSGDMESVVNVLSKGVDVNVVHQGKTLLITCAMTGKANIVSYLLAEGTVFDFEKLFPLVALMFFVYLFIFCFVCFIRR
jgi:ankyrin repeat protein